MKHSTIPLAILCILCACSLGYSGEAAPDGRPRGTDDDSAISVQRQHIMVYLAEGEMRISEVVLANNSGAKTVVAKDAARGSFRVSLPAGASDVKLSGAFDPEHSKVAGGVAIYAQELRPGTQQFVLQYVLRYDRASYALALRLDYDTAAVDFIFPDGLGTAVSSKDFDQQRMVKMGSRQYQYLTAANRKAGSTLTVTLTLPMPPSNAFRWPALAITCVAAALCIGLGIRRRGDTGSSLANQRCYGPEIWVAGVAMQLAVLAGLVYAPSAQTGEVQRIMYFHVPSAWVSFLAFFVTFIASIMVLAKRSEWWDGVATASAEIGTLFCTLALVSGCIWGKAAWNVWWVWDARLSTTLILWLIYVVYILLRMSTPSAERSARFGAVYAIIGFINVPIVFLSIRLWRTQHPAAVVMGGQGTGLEPKMLYALLFCMGAFTLLYLSLLRGRLRLERLRKALQ